MNEIWNCLPGSLSSKKCSRISVLRTKQNWFLNQDHGHLNKFLDKSEVQMNKNILKVVKRLVSLLSKQLFLHFWNLQKFNKFYSFH